MATNKEPFNRIQLIREAAVAYETSNDVIPPLDCWDYFLTKNGKLKKAGLAGDTLIDFIIRELGETLDENGSREEQLDEAIRVMDKASQQLESVVNALRKLY